MTTNALTIDVPEGLPFVEMTREFEHPVEKLYRAHTERELMQRWFGPRDAHLTVQTWDARPGGRYRYVALNDGVEYAFNGVFHTARLNEQIIQTFEFEMYPDSVGVEFYRFEALDGGRSRLTIRSVYATVEARDGAAASGMESGVIEGYERCDEVLATL